MDYLLYQIGGKNMKKLHIASVMIALIVAAPMTANAHEFLVGKEKTQEIDVATAGETRIITFSNAVNPETIEGKIHLTDLTDDVTVAIEAKPDGNKINVSLVDASYKEGHEYELLIDDTLTDTNGQTLMNGVKYVYKTVNTGELTETDNPPMEQQKPSEPEVQPNVPEAKPETPEVTPVEPEPENPLSYKNAEHVLRSYDMGNDITYYVMKYDGAANYEVQITIGDELVGGYYGVEGKELYGYTIGEKNPTARTHAQFKLTPLIDKLNGNTLIGVTYESKNYKDKTKLREAMQLNTSTNLLEVSKVYADLATQFRAQHGKAALVAHDVLTQAAKNHSTDMATNNYFTHKSLTGMQPWDRIDAIKLIGWSKVGENIAGGRSSIFEAHVGWINSLGHRTNLLSTDFTHVGYGAHYNKESDYKLYHTTVFVKLRK